MEQLRIEDICELFVELELSPTAASRWIRSAMGQRQELCRNTHYSSQSQWERWAGIRVVSCRHRRTGKARRNLKGSVTNVASWHEAMKRQRRKLQDRAKYAQKDQWLKWAENTKRNNRRRTGDNQRVIGKGKGAGVQVCVDWS